MHIVALDIGSSSIKGAMLDCDTRTMSHVVSRPFPQPIDGLPAGFFEVDPQQVASEVRGVLDQLAPHAREARAVFVSSQMGGTILVDESGNALTNYLSWRDQRTLQPADNGKTYLQQVREAWGNDLLATIGNELPAGSAFGLLFWLNQNAKLPRSGKPISIGDYVIGRLGNRTPSMHVTHGIGMLDLRTVDWHREALDRLGLQEVALAKLSRSIESQASLKIGGKDLPIYGAYGDQQCALRGAGLERGELSINVSTGSQVSRRATRFSPGNYQTRLFFDGDWLDTITHLPAGRSLNVLLDLLTELARAEGVELRDAWKSVVRLASESHAGGQQGLDVDLAFFAGPMGDRGNIGGITTENLTVGSLFCAAFKNMADNYAACSQRLAGENWKSIVVSGGLVQAVPPLRSMIESHFTAPLRCSSGEETFLGLAELARAVL
jgi:sugar (pentulose or hexulose) kinase